MSKNVTIGRVKATELLKGIKGFASAVIVKDDGTERKLTFRPSVTKNLKKSSRKAPNVEQIGMMRVYDMMEKDYRTINLQTFKSLTTGGITYKIRK